MDAGAFSSSLVTDGGHGGGEGSTPACNPVSKEECLRFRTELAVSRYYWFLEDTFVELQSLIFPIILRKQTIRYRYFASY
jgi:hypothetical protein